ncbi:MAG: hypothetical protein AAF264_05895 [Pseudomonadota bacterium]
MTAIDGLDRLETPALWRQMEGGLQRAVYVSIGEAELVIQDPSGIALAHWSLPALIRRNPRKLPARYAPDPTSGEELEIEEAEMVAALDRVTAAVARGRRSPGRLRRAGIGLVLGLGLGFAVLWTPGFLRDLTANSLPLPAQAEIGRRMLDQIADLTGPPCATPVGTEVLETLRARLLPLRQARFTVLRDLPQPALALPGGHFALSDELLVIQDDPELLAGHVLATALTAGTDGPLRALLADLSTFELVRLLASGAVAERALSAHTEARLLAAPPAPDGARLRPGFATARLGWGSYATATGLHVPADAPPMPPALDDAAWQALRGICDG